MAITITNTGADTFISDGSQVPNFNKNFIVGLTKATAINNPLTAGLDSVLVLDNTGRSIVFAYSDIADINGSTPIALGLADAIEVASYLNNNFFEFGDGGLTSVATSSPLTGDGTGGNPVTLDSAPTNGLMLAWNGSAWVYTFVNTSGIIQGNGTTAAIKLQDGVNAGDIAIWNGSAWVIQPNPSWNLEARRNVKTFTFAGGFGLSGGGINGDVMLGTPFRRNSANVMMLTPGEANRDPIVQIVNAAGMWNKLMTPFTAGSHVVLNQTTTKKYYYRQRIRLSSLTGGAIRCGFMDVPFTTVLGGFGFEFIGMTTVRAFCNSGSSFTFGANYNFTASTWNDYEVEYEYISGNMVAKLFVNGILASTATRTVASFSNNCAIGFLNAGGASAAIVHSDLIEYSIYG